MTVHGTVSKNLGAVLFLACRGRITKGRPYSLPISLWRRIPNAVKDWLRRRVFPAAEDAAWKGVENHEHLMALRTRENTSWIISSSAMLMLWRILLENTPRRIIEFGSGLTTEIFCRYAAVMSERGIKVSIVSVEHAKEWYDAAVAKLNATDESLRAAIIHAPLTEQYLLNRELVAYTVDPTRLREAAGKSGFDFCFIDGPPGTVGRAGCLPLIADNLSDNAMVVLDDAARPTEQAVLDEWMSFYPGRMKGTRIFLGDTHGLAVFHWRKRLSEIGAHPGAGTKVA